MAISVMFEDRLDGSSNYSTCGERITLALEDNEIWEFVDKTFLPPIDATSLAVQQKKNVKARNIILDG